MRGSHPRLAAGVLAAATAAVALAAAAAPASAAAPGPKECPDLDSRPVWYGSNGAALQHLIDTQGRCGERRRMKHAPLALFDWDNTVVRNDVGDATMFWLLRNSRLHQPVDWGNTSRYLTPRGRIALNGACGPLAAPGDLLPTDPSAAVPTPPAPEPGLLDGLLGSSAPPAPTSTPEACADEILAIYGDGETSAGDPAFAGYNARRIEPAYAWAAQLMAGWRPAQVRDFARQARAQNLHARVGREQRVGSSKVTAWVRYYRPIKNLISTLQRAGFDVWIVSASQEQVVETWAGPIGVAPSHVIGIRQTLSHGRLTSHLQGCGPVHDGEDSLITYIDGKRCWINQEILGIDGSAALEKAPQKKRQVFAAGDSNTDVTFVSDATKLHLVINRNKAELMCRAYANEDGNWLINPQFIEPAPKLEEGYSCSTDAYTRPNGSSGPVIGRDGKPIPDQEDTIHG